MHCCPQITAHCRSAFCRSQHILIVVRISHTWSCCCDTWSCCCSLFHAGCNLFPEVTIYCSMIMLLLLAIRTSPTNHVAAVFAAVCYMITWTYTSTLLHTVCSCLLLFAAGRTMLLNIHDHNIMCITVMLFNLMYMLLFPQLCCSQPLFTEFYCCSMLCWTCCCCKHDAILLHT